MKNRYKLFITCILYTTITQAQPKPAIWQTVTQPGYAEMAKNFATPPAQYAHTLTWGLQGAITREIVARDLDAIYKQGLRVVSIEGGYGMPEPYLSEGYFENVKLIVEELKKRNMHLWIIDEGKYPSGFAGGFISQKSPEMRMQGIVVFQRLRTEDNKPLSADVPKQSLSAIAVNTATQENKLLDISSVKLNWPATPGVWQITVAGHRYKTSVTRAANNPSHGKDTVNSLIDYLNPAATRKFMEYTHVQYKKYVGNEFGKTILGFRGDEPEYGFTPWTPDLLQIFKEKKKYDIQPYIASFFIPKPTEEQRMAQADFYDVWSDLFRDNFFKVQADWCRENGMEYMVHLDHEDMLMKLVHSEGDFFKTMRHVQVPGVDAIWHQIWYDNVTDFPKLASSAAHMYGRPRSLSESFAAYRPAPTVNDARWVVNEQMVRGINLFEYMFWPLSAGSSSNNRGYLHDTAFVKLAAYSNRAAYLLSNGIPAARVGLYFPTESMWTGNSMADSTLRVIGKNLLEHQIDFDYVDQQGLSTDFKLDKGSFTNLSGQKYTAIVLPSTNIISAALLARLKTFAQGGGKVIFAGEIPQQVANENFLKASALAKPSWASYADWTNLTDDFYKQLPHDVAFKKSAPSVKYLHRSWKDAELYFFFNEGSDTQNITATLNGTGSTSFWDADNGTTSPVTGTTKQGTQTRVPLQLKGYESRFVIIKR